MRPHGTARTIHIPLWPVTHADLHPGEVAIALPWTPTAPQRGWGELFCLRGGWLADIFAPPVISSHPIVAPPRGSPLANCCSSGEVPLSYVLWNLPLAAGVSHDARNANTFYRWAGQKPQYLWPGEPGCSVFSQNMAIVCGPILTMGESQWHCTSMKL